MVTFEKQLIRQASVIANWLPQGDAFWYLRNGKGDKSEFIFVDILKKTRGPAFDHKQLASELHRQTGVETNHETLPFTRIEIQPDASYVCFRFAGKKWQYGPDNVLQEIENGDDDESDGRLLQKEIPSGHSSNPVSVKFINHSNDAVQLFWIDWDAKPIFYADIDIGATHQQETYQGHVWRIVNEASGQTIGVYSAPSQSNDMFVIQNRETKQLKDTSSEELDDNPESKTGNNVTDRNDDEAKGTSTVDIKDSEEQSEAQESSPGPDESGEPKRQLFVSDNNIWLRERDGNKARLSSNGSEDSEYDDSNIYMSPDEQYVVAWQLTPAQEHLINLIESSPADRIEPRLQSIQYLKPGDRIKEAKLHLFDLESRLEINVDDSLFTNPYHLESIGWSSNGEEYRFIFNERGYQHIRVLSICRDGRVQALLEENSNTFIDYSSKMYCWVVEDSDEMIWASERDGYNHLYLVDLNEGTVQTQITQGPWNVRSVDHVDESRRRIWLKVLGVVQDQDPYYAYPAYVNFDGTGFRILAEGDGTHSWSLSPDQRYIVDTWSRVNLPPQTHLRDGETGESILFLEGSTLEDLQGEPWDAPEIFIAPGRDGNTPIHGVLIRPSNFDETKSYPILEDIYAGPQDFFTPKAFSAFTSQRKWANQGYVVVKLDGMGTNWRSKSFHDVCYKNLKDGGLPDRIAWTKAAASTRPWMDLARVGIFGGSAGGQNAAAAVLHHGDFYKAAAADCGCHDNRMDKLWWNEQWMGYPVDESYAKSSNVTHAAKLSGALMLIAGGLDKNVDPSSTMQFVQALNEADKEYEFLYMPGEGHGCGGSEYGLRRQRAFFKRHLCP